MDLSKIVRLVAVLFAVVAALVDVPQAAVIIAVLGLVAGWFIEEDRAMMFLVVTIALGVCHGALNAIPGVGEYLTAILGSVSGLFYAAACTVIVVGLVKRLMP